MPQDGRAGLGAGVAAGDEAGPGLRQLFGPSGSDGDRAAKEPVRPEGGGAMKDRLGRLAEIEEEIWLKLCFAFRLAETRVVQDLYIFHAGNGPSTA